MNNHIESLKDSISLITFFLNNAYLKLSGITDIYNNSDIQKEIENLETSLKCLSDIKEVLEKESVVINRMNEKLNATYAHQHTLDRMTRID